MNNEQEIRFVDAQQLAQFLSEIVRQGMTFIVYSDLDKSWTVRLTGGF